MIVGLWVGSAFTQDLGSSNKLFPKSAKTEAKPKKKSPAVSKSKRRTPGSAKQSTAVKKAAPPSAGAGSASGPAMSFAEIDQKYKALLLEGKNAFGRSELAASESAYDRAAELKPKDPSAFISLGIIYYYSLRFELAEKAFRKALVLDPKNAEVYFALSSVLSQPVAAPDLSGRYEEAIDLARKAIEIKPNSAAAFDQHGAALERDGLLGAETESAYRKAISIDPSYAPAYAHLGRLLRKTGRGDAARQAYASAIKNAGEPMELISVADSFQSEQRSAESIPLLKRVLAGDRDNYATLVLLGRALSRNGDIRGAESYLWAATQASPMSFAAFGELARLYLRQEVTGPTESVLAKGEAVADGFERRDLAGFFEQLGDLYAKHKMPNDALRSYKKAMSLDPLRASLAGKVAANCR